MLDPPRRSCPWASSPARSPSGPSQRRSTVCPAKRAPFVALVKLLRRRYPGIDDPAALVRSGLVLVDGAPALNPKSQVRSDVGIRLVRTRPLRGTLKLQAVLDSFVLDV